MTGTTARIRWSEDGLAVYSGYVGQVGAQLFTIAAPSHDGQGYLLMSRLPGMDYSCSRPRLEQAQAEAERWLEEFVSSLGAVFPPESPPMERASRTARDFYRSVTDPAPPPPEGRERNRA